MSKTKVLLLMSMLSAAAPALSQAPMQAPMSMPLQQSVTFDAVYVVNGGDGMTGSISVINAETNTVAGTIQLMNAMWPHHIYLSRDGSKLVVAIPGMDLSMGHGTGQQAMMPGAVAVLDARTGATIKSTLLPTMNHNALFSPDQTEIWTSQMMMMGSVLVLDAKTLATKQSIAVGQMPAEVTFSPDGRRAFVADGMSNDVSVIDVARKTVSATIPVGMTPVVPSQARNGLVYVDDEEGMQVSAIDRRSQAVRLTYDLGFTPGYAKLGPDGHLWVTDVAGRVVLFSQAAPVRQHVITVGAGAHGIAFSSDGNTAYVTNQMANTVSVIDVDSLRVKATINVGVKPNGLLFREDDSPRRHWTR